MIKLKKMYSTSKINFLLIIASLVLAVILVGCGSNKEPFAVQMEPILSIIAKQDTTNFAIVLHDMDISEDDAHIYYKHKYLTVNPSDDQIKMDSTDWVNVSKGFFEKHEKDLGMELVSRFDGPISTVVKPFGFDWAIGNEKYGEWVVDSTSTKTTTDSNGQQQRERRWSYYPGSSFLFYYWMFSRPIYYGSYRGYDAYRGRSAYYGSGSRSYGTSSPYQKKNRSSFYSRKAKSSSWSKRSSGSRRSGSSSRYKGGSSTRGRSGGFGK